MGKESFKELEYLFDRQILDLKAFSYAPEMVEQCSCQKKAILDKAQTLSQSEEFCDMRFFPVMPLDPSWASSRYLKDIEDSVETPKDPYYIFNVLSRPWADGINMADTKRSYRKEGRRGLLFREIISFMDFFRDLLYLRDLSVVALSSSLGPADAECIACVRNGNPTFVGSREGTYDRCKILVPCCMVDKPIVTRRAVIEEISHESLVVDKRLEDEDWFKEAKEMFGEELEE